MTGKTPLGGWPWIPILVAQSIVVLASGAVDSGGQRTGGIAARYPGDSGIARDPDVIFADDFESWREEGARPPDATWRVRTNRTSRTRAIPGKVTIDGVRGANVLEIACWTEGRGSQVGGLSRKLGNYNHAGEGLGNGYEEVYVRYYIKFDENYRAVRNHGANLGGRDVTRKDAAWVGMAGIRDVSTRGYFYSGVQPRGKRGSMEVEMGFYSYHLDKKGPWGDGYEARKRIPIKVGTWHCVERHLKLNSVDRTKPDPATADGLEELWIDGELAIRREGLRFRRVPELRITFFSLETYYHGLPEEYRRSSPLRVFFDNVVIARKPIGPVAPSTSDLLAMPAVSWRKLKPKGMAYARMYSGCCAGGGLLWYFGGAHRGYKGNDVQLYEPRANEWIQATEPEWPEVGSKDWKAMTSGGGRTSRLSPTGRPYTEHSYQQVCWQPERRRFFVVLVSSGTWEFDPRDRKWIHLINRFENPDGPRGVWAQNHVLYEPAWKAPVLICGTSKPGIYKFEHKGRRWTRMGKRSDELAWNEFYSTYVPTWKAHLISTMKRGFFKLHVVANKVTPIEAPEALTRCQSLSYDPAGGVVIALASKPLTERSKTVVPWAMDVETMQWTELDPPKPWPEGQTTGRWAKLWYDAHHNVHLFVNDVRRDREQLFDGGVTETWAFRYK